jgi:hypothetical protein
MALKARNSGYRATAASASVESELFMGVVWGDTETHGKQGGVVSIVHGRFSGHARLPEESIPEEFLGMVGFQPNGINIIGMLHISILQLGRNSRCGD